MNFPARLPTRLLGLFCIVLSLSTWARGDFTFIHCSDIHIGAGDNDKTDAKLFTEITQLSPKPVLVFNTGDVCEYGTDEQYELYRETLKSLGDVKMYPSPGNHDVRWNPRGKEGYTKGTNSPLYRSWDHENIHFVILDSTVLLEHWGHISQEQLNWLKDDLKKVGTEKPVILGFHHWIGRETVQTDNEQALLELVKPYNVVLWLQGHGHSDIAWNVNGTPATMVKGLYQGSYNIIEVTKDELKIRKRHIPTPKKNDKDLIRDKSAPPVEINPETVPLMTIPLARRPEPQWSAEAKLVDDGIEVTATAPEGATLDYRMNSAAPKQMTGGRAKLPTTMPGEHVITVQATLPDGRSFQRPVPFKMQGSAAPVWEINVGAEVQSRLVRTNDAILVSTMGTDLVALNPTDGSEKYRAKTGGPIFSAAHVDGETAYFGSADHFVYAIDAATGNQKWKTETGGAVLAGPSAAKGIVCVGSTDTKIYGLDATSGSIIWTVPGQNMFQSKTATDGERFFVGGWDNHFRCIDAKSGEVLWDLVLGKAQKYQNFSAFAPAITAPAVGNGKVFVSTNDGILHALNIADGKEAWHVDWKNMGYSSPIFHDGRVYCALSDKNKVFCVDADTGEMKWTTDTAAVIYDSSFCFGGGNVFIGNVNGTLNSIRASDGKIEWQYRLGPGHLLGSPIADEQKVYMGSMSGKVIAMPLHASEAPQPAASR